MKAYNAVIDDAKDINCADALLNLIEPIAKRCINESQGHIPVAFILLNDELRIVGFAGNLTDKAKQAIRLLFEASAIAGARLLGFVSEGWMAKGESAMKHWDKHKTFANYVVEEKGEIITRQEILLISAASPSELVMRTFPLIRNGDMAYLGDKVDFKTAEKIESRFLSDLPWRLKDGPSKTI